MAKRPGWGDTGYNGNEVILTPHLDQMAKDGIQFDRFYAASAVCSPTRASFLTGRNPYRTGVFSANRGVLRPEETTISELLQKEEKYFGKWHLGTFTHTEKDANAENQVICKCIILQVYMDTIWSLLQVCPNLQSYGTPRRKTLRHQLLE